jgi:hypothetical protein
MTKIDIKISLNDKNNDINNEVEKKTDNVIKENTLNKDDINTLNKDDIKNGDKNDKKNEKLKCNICNKKIKLVESIYCRCKCGIIFCDKHRFAGLIDSENSHNCKFDYIKSFKNDLKIENHKIVQKKVDKI